MKNCPLCSSTSLTPLEEVSVPEITSLYQRFLKVDCLDEFAGVEKITFVRCDHCSLRFFAPMVTGSEYFYEQLQKIPWYYLDEKAEYDYAAGFIKSTDQVLEVGAGKGAFSGKIPSKNYLGLELSRSAKEMAERSGIPVVIESVQDHALQNTGRYDVVCSFQVLEHVTEIGSFISSCVDCLRPGGLLIFSTPSADTFVSMAENNILNITPHHQTWWSDKTLHQVARIHELKLVGLEHERLADIHLRWYADIIALKGLKEELQLRSKLIDTGHGLNGRVKEVASVVERGLANPLARPQGHSVTVVYQK